MTQWGLEALFNPAKRHVEEEKRRLQATREEIGDSSGGQRIDLESGKVTITRKPKPVEAAAESETKPRKRKRSKDANQLSQPEKHKSE